MVTDLTEKEFQAQVLDLAVTLGWCAYHTYDSRRSARGFPDLVLVKAPRVLFAELKTAKGRLTDPQRLWLMELRDCPGVETHLWRPDDMDEIVQVLNKGPKGADG